MTLTAEPATTPATTPDALPEASRVRVIYRDSQQVRWTRVALRPGIVDESHLPVVIALADPAMDAKPKHFQVLRVIPLTGNRAADLAALYVARAEMTESMARVLRGLLGTPSHREYAPHLSEKYIAEAYDGPAARLRAQAAKLTA